MRLAHLNSQTIAGVFGPADTIGWRLWYYRNLIGDFNADGTTDIAVVSNVLLEQFGTLPATDPRTFLTVISLTPGGAVDTTAQYAPTISIPGWSRRTYATDLNADGRADFVFIQNREDGRTTSGTGAAFAMGHPNTVMLSQPGGGYDTRTFSGDYWSHLGAIGDIDNDGNADLIEGYFRDAAGTGGIIHWEFDQAAGNFAQQRTLAGIQASSAHLTGEWLVANKAYPYVADIVAVNLATGTTETLLSRAPDFVTRTIPLWNGNVATMSLRQEGTDLFLENGIGEALPMARNGQAGWLGIQDDRDVYALEPDGITYRVFNQQDFHVYDVENRRIVQTMAGQRAPAGPTYTNSYSVVDLNGDGLDDVLFPTHKIYWSLPDGTLFRSGFSLGARSGDAEFATLLSNESFVSIAAHRQGNNLVLVSMTEPTFGSVATGTYTPNYALQSLGLDGFAGDYGVVSSVPSTFPILEVVQHEAAKAGLTLASLTAAHGVFARATDGTHHAVNVAVDGTLSFTAGGAGDDTLVAAPATQVLVGGAGTDTATFPGTRLEYRIGARDGIILLARPGETHTLLDIEHIAFADAPAISRDDLVRDADPLFAVSRGSAAFLMLPDLYNGPVPAIFFSYTGTGVGEVVGGTFRRDFIDLLGGDDTAHGSGGNDTIDGGAGNDTIDYSRGARPDDTFAVAVNLATGSTIHGRHAFDEQYFQNPIDTLLNFENVIGTAFADSLTGDGADNLLTGGPGNDFLDGAGGTDTAVFSGARESYRIGIAGNWIGVAGPDGTDTLKDIELLQFGASAPITAESLRGQPGTHELMSFITSGQLTYALPLAYAGPLDLKYLYPGTDNDDVVAGTSHNDFMNLAGGNDAAQMGAGDDIVDGGGGNNFLTGGPGRDSFFLDGRFLVPVWSCITDWEDGEALTLWGWTAGVSKAAWSESDGLPGYLGATMFADIDGNGRVETAVTWTGRTLASIPAAKEMTVSGIGVLHFE